MKNLVISVCALAIVGATAFAHGSAEISFASQDQQIYEAGRDGVTNPKCISCPAPSYTDSARQKRISGDVILDVIVLPDGTAGDISVATSLEPSLDTSAVETVRKQWRFEPAQKDGKPVKVHVKISVSFHIK